MNSLDLYCVTNKVIKNLENTNLILAGVGKEIFSSNYLKSDTGDNIFFKEKNYSELTFHYWYWKNNLDLKKKDTWVGFCQKRRFWVKENIEKKKINKDNLNNYLLKEPHESWKQFDSILCEPINVNKVKKIKIIKRGFKNLIKDPTILFNQKKRTIRLHFDMHHGFGNLKKAIDLVDIEDRSDFLNFVNTSTSYNPHIMFIAKPQIVNRWFNTLFPWLLRCEKEFGFEELQGYDTQRLYAYLAERYLSFWFNKHTKTLAWPWIFFDANQ